MTCLLLSAARCRLASSFDPTAGAVQRLLDGQDVRIVGGLIQQRNDGLVGIVGVVEQNVLFVEYRKQIVVLGAHQNVGWLQRRISEHVEPGQLGQREQHAQIQRTRDQVDVVLAQLQSVAKRGDQRVRSSCLDLQPNDVASPPAPDFALDGFEVGAASFFIQFQLGVPRETNDSRLDDLLSGKEIGQMGSNDLLEQDKSVTALRDLHETCQTCRNLNDGEALFLGFRRAGQDDGKIQAERGQERKRPRLVDRERRQDRRHRVAEECGDRRAIPKLLERDDPNLVFRQRRQELARRQVVECGHEVVAATSDSCQLLLRCQPRQVDGRIVVRDGLV